MIIMSLTVSNLMFLTLKIFNKFCLYKYEGWGLNFLRHLVLFYVHKGIKCYILFFWVQKCIFLSTKMYFFECKNVFFGVQKCIFVKYKKVLNN